MGTDSSKLDGFQSTDSLFGGQAENMFANLFEHMLNGIAYCRMLYENGRPVDFVYLFTNQAFHTQTGLGSVKGKCVSDVIPGIQESDQELIDTYGRVASGGAPERFETYVEALKQWFEVSVYSPRLEHFVAVFDVITTRKQRELELVEAQRVAHVGNWYWNAKTDENTVSEELYRIFGRKRIPPFAEQNGTLYPPDAWYELNAAVQEAVRSGIGYCLDIPALREDATQIWINTRCNPVHNTSGEVIGLRGTVQDITVRKRVEEELAESELRFRGAFETAAHGMALVSIDGRFSKVNSSFCAMIGYGDAELLATDFQTITHPDDLAADLDQVHRLLAGQIQSYNIEKRYFHKNGSIVWVLLSVSLVRANSGAPLHFVAQIQDITDRKRAAEQIYDMAFHDSLTGLPNRSLLNDRLERALAASKRSGCYGALLFLDLDNFKSLNDTHGHEVGDMLLVEAANRLTSCVREADTVARFGGDEFVVMLSELNEDQALSTSQARVVAEKILFSLSEPYRLTIRAADAADAIIEHHCTVSIGVALFGDNAGAQSDILKWADTAMYDAKEAGRNSVRFAVETTLQEGVKDRISANFVQLIWHQVYECGNGLIDSQHRALFGDANRLLTAELSGQPIKELAALIDVLILDIVQHFKDEEEIIAATGFPGKAEHAAIHRELVDRAGELVGRFHAGTLGIGELFQFLANDVIARHMLGADREYFQYLAPAQGKA